MAKRVSHSLLDPWLAPLVPKLYGLMHIPRWYPPEGVIAIGHACAIVGAVGFGLATTHWWGGLLIAAGVLGNHLADMLDGTHARRTGQCRNGGELLDHFTDPLSFSYWMAGLAVSFGRLDLGIAAIIILYATAVLVNIKAKLLGEFTLARFGPTEFKMLLATYGIVMASIVRFAPTIDTRAVALGWMWILLPIGAVQLVVNLVRAVREVNASGQPADSSEWKLGAAATPAAPPVNPNVRAQPANEAVDRRMFCLALGSFAASTMECVQADPTPTRSMTLGFSTYGSKELPIAESVRAIADAGFDSVEMCVQPGWDTEPNRLSRPDRARLRAMLIDHRLVLTSLMEQLTPSRTDEQHVEALDRLRRAAEFGHDLSPERPPLIQTVLGGGEWDAVRNLFRDRLAAWLDACRSAGVVLAIKPHRGGAMSRPEHAFWLHKQLGASKWMRMVYDYSHYIFRDMTLEGTVKESVPILGHVAVKDTVLRDGKAVFELPGSAGTVDYVLLLRLLHQSGYAGDVSCEVSGMIWNRPGYDPRAAIKTCATNLSNACRTAGLARPNRLPA